MAAVRDDVWQRLDLPAARLGPRTRLRLKIAVLAAVVVLIGGAWVHTSGAVTPRVIVEHGWDAAFEYPDGTAEEQIFATAPKPTTRVRQGFWIVNDGSFPLTILGADHDRPGMRVTHVTVGEIHLEGTTWRTGGRPLTPDAPFRLEPQERASLQIHYDITDCDLVPSTPDLVPLRVALPWITKTVEVEVPPLNVEDGGWGVSDWSDPHAVAWQRYLADRVCAVAGR